MRLFVISLHGWLSLLSRALEILTDVAARAAYDQTRKAKIAAKERNKVLDSKRKKFKADLETRERACLEQKREAAEKKRLQQEIERLRQEGSRLLEQEKEISNYCSFVDKSCGKSDLFSGFKYTQSGSTIDRDYESIVLMKMRQAEERKKLIEELKEDEDD